jgi:hypothetical protein
MIIFHVHLLMNMIMECWPWSFGAYGRRFIWRCKQGCLQFVILKPIFVVITCILYAKGKYEDGNFSVNQSYLYITIIYTISYSMALFVLALFYAACRDLLQPHNPAPKYIMIKSVVFLTYWQVKWSVKIGAMSCRWIYLWATILFKFLVWNIFIQVKWYHQRNLCYQMENCYFWDDLLSHWVCWFSFCKIWIHKKC